MQVEHPVTEEVTGVDLVRAQINIAKNEYLELKQKDVEFNGHALEVRLYAENPNNDFLPETGKIVCYEPYKNKRDVYGFRTVSNKPEKQKNKRCFFFPPLH